MANPFLNKNEYFDRDVDTALLLDKAIITNIGNAVAYTDGHTIFINTEENLTELLPVYDIRVLKWILWHEEYHMQLVHHHRFFKYINELSAEDLHDEFHVTKDEVNIIMDILVHDSLSKLFPEIIDVAVACMFQFRNRNSLKYTFKTFTLEDMLDEYSKHKHGEDDKDKEGKDKDKDHKDTIPGTKGHKKDDKDTPDKDDKDKDDKDTPDKDEDGKAPSSGTTPDEHDKTDWSKLEKLDNKEFITDIESDRIQEGIKKVKEQKLKLAKLTETLNSLVTSTRKRTYAMPSTIHVGGSVLLKGSVPGRASLYLCFDASGSMYREMDMFKEIISKSIPQAMNTPCEWFAGEGEEIAPYKRNWQGNYFKGKFNDFMPVIANSGYDDDGDRTIELCYKAEQLGYSPIGITDGGGKISKSKPLLKQLKRTVLVGHKKSWLEQAQKINPSIKVLDI